MTKKSGPSFGPHENTNDIGPLDMRVYRMIRRTNGRSYVTIDDLYSNCWPRSKQDATREQKENRVYKSISRLRKHLGTDNWIKYRRGYGWSWISVHNQKKREIFALIRKIEDLEHLKELEERILGYLAAESRVKKAEKARKKRIYGSG